MTMCAWSPGEAEAQARPRAKGMPKWNGADDKEGLLPPWHQKGGQQWPLSLVLCQTAWASPEACFSPWAATLTQQVAA